MKLTLSLLTSLTLFGNAVAQETVEEKIKVQSSLQTTLSYLDTDGEQLSISDVGGFLKFYAECLDEYMLPAMRRSTDEFPRELSFDRIYDLTGLGKATAIGSSSKKYDNFHHGRYFIDTKGSRKGLFSLLGEESAAWNAPLFAPESTDFVFETQLDLKKAPKLILDVLSSINKDVADTTKENFAQPLPGVEGLTAELFLASLNARISIIGEVDGEMNMKETPKLKLSARIDGVTKQFWEAAKTDLSKNFEMKSNGEVHTFTSPQPLPLPWGEHSLMIVFDLKKDHIWVSLHAEHLKACQGDGAKLGSNKSYQAAMQHLSPEGCTHFYLSQKVIKSTLAVTQQTFTFDKDNPFTMAMHRMLGDAAKHINKGNGIAATITHDDKGLLTTINTPFRIRGSIMSYYAQMVPAMAAISYGPIVKNLKKGDEVMAIQRMKNVHASLLNYAIKREKRFPDNLELLIEAGCMDDDRDTFVDTFNGPQKMGYVGGYKLTDNGNNVILFSASPQKGKYIIGTISGAVRSITEKEFVAIMKEQTNLFDDEEEE